MREREIKLINIPQGFSGDLVNTICVQCLNYDNCIPSLDNHSHVVSGLNTGVDRECLLISEPRTPLYSFEETNLGGRSVLIEDINTVLQDQNPYSIEHRFAYAALMCLDCLLVEDCRPTQSYVSLAKATIVGVSGQKIDSNECRLK